MATQINLAGAQESVCMVHTTEIPHGPKCLTYSWLLRRGQVKCEMRKFADDSQVIESRTHSANTKKALMAELLGIRVVTEIQQT